MNLPEELVTLLKKRESDNSQLTLVTGVFDVLHQQHRQFLLEAKKIAPILIVALESDQRVRILKGEGRPINNVVKRQENLQQWGIADLILLLPVDFGETSVRQAWLAAIKPDYLAVSSHTPFLAIKKQELAAVNGQVKVVHQFNPQISSSKIIDKRNHQMMNNHQTTRSNQ